MDDQGAKRMKSIGADAIGLCSTLLINGLGQLNFIRENLQNEENEDFIFNRKEKMGEADIYVDRLKCSNCGECVKHCGYMAINIKSDILSVDSSKCRRCGLCEQFCELGAISIN